MERLFGKRDENETVLLPNAVIGFGSRSDEEEWFLGDKPVYGVLRDIETPTQYLVDNDGRVATSFFMPIPKPKPLVRILNKFYGLMPVTEVLEKSKDFFDTLEKKGYEQEISKIREKFSLILSRIKNYPGDSLLYVSELNRIFEDLKQLYKYACSDLTTDKVRTPILNPRDPNEELNASNLYLGKTVYRNNERRNGKVGVLELVDYVLDEEGTILYRDLTRDSYYFVNRNGDVVVPRNWVIEEYGVYPTTNELQSFTHPVNLEEAIENCENKQRRKIFDKGDRQTFKGAMSSINAEKDGIMPFKPTVRNIRDNMDFLLKCYVTEIETPSLYEQRYQNLSHLISDVVEDISLLGISPKDKVYKQD